MMRRLLWTAPLVFALGCQFASAPDDMPPPAVGVAAQHAVGTDPGHAGHGTALVAQQGHALAAFAAGCFWGVEDAFRKVPGVIATAVGYSGGHTTDPTYEDRLRPPTGHAETVLVEFDPDRVSYERLLSVFFRIHDPTTPNRQGPDVGDQYRSAIFTFSPEQAAAARDAVAQRAGEAAPAGGDGGHAHRAVLEGRGLPPAVRGADRAPRLPGPEPEPRRSGDVSERGARPATLRARPLAPRPSGSGVRATGGGGVSRCDGRGSGRQRPNRCTALYTAP